MKKIVFVMSFLALSMIGMAQVGTYKVERFCRDELKADTSFDAKVLTFLNAVPVNDLTPDKLTIGRVHMEIEYSSKSTKSNGTMNAFCRSTKQEGNKWYYSDRTVVEKLGDKDYVLRLENGTPIMYLTKLD